MPTESDHEEGEVEEGEVPEDIAAAAAAAVQKDTAAEPALQPEHPPEPAAAAPPPAEQPASNGGTDASAQDPSMRSEQREPHKRAGSSDRREEHRSSSRPDPSSKPGRDKDPEREREELANELIKLTSHVAFVDIRNRWVGSCQDLKEAIKKLDKLLRKVKRKKSEELERYPALLEFSAAILEGLRNVGLIGSSSQGRSVDLEPARALVRAALNYRHDIFSVTQKKEVESLVQENREFRSIWEERTRGKGATAAAEGAEEAPSTQQQQQQQGGSAEGHEAAPPIENGDAAADGQAEQQQHTLGGSTTSVQRSQLGAAGAAGSRIKIVVNQNTPQPDGEAAAAGSGLKRAGHAATDDPEYQQQQEAPAAKRPRHDANGVPGSPSAAAGSSHMEIDGSGPAAQRQPVPLLPELAAALESPSELQVAMQELLEQRKLCLVLDLDHTLVNSVKFGEVDPEWEFKLEQMVAQQAHLPGEQRDLYRLPRVGMWTKLRPGVREFLRRAADSFELWIHTAGTRSYALAMVELLDPQGTYFAGRIIAQGINAPPGEEATPDVQFKRLMQGLEGREPMVIIVDDSSAVWPHDRRSLFVVERYVYFPSSRKRGGMSGRSLLEIDRDECPSRGMLMTALRVFNAIHQQVFRTLAAAPADPNPATGAGPISDWDARAVMASEKARVLGGVHLVFSRVIPLESDPQQHPLWLLAEQFGATCSVGCTDNTTHVVATHGGTEKVLWAKQRNRHVVSPAWLECSCIMWSRASEDRFPTPY